MSAWLASCSFTGQRHGDGKGVIPVAEQKQKETKSTRPLEVVETDAPNSRLTKKGEDLKKEMDSMLDEIDDILEENAEEFVASYVQRGGQ